MTTQAQALQAQADRTAYLQGQMTAMRIVVANLVGEAVAADPALRAHLIESMDALKPPPGQPRAFDTGFSEILDSYSKALRKRIK